MARPKEFDRGAALKAATEIFWERGYQATTLQQLVDRMGISRASLYDTFGNKHALFCEAMDCYTTWLKEEFLAPLRNSGPANEVLRGFFQGLVQAFCSGNFYSCLVIKSAVTVCPEDTETADRVLRFNDYLTDAFHQLLLRAREAGDFSESRSILATSRFLNSSLQGLWVTASIRKDRQVLQDAINGVLSVLD